MTALREKAPTILTAEGARRLTGKIRDAVSYADDLMVQAYEGRIWEVSQPSYPSWSAWVDGELPQLKLLKPRAGLRREVVRQLRERGATIPDLVAATGSSLGTVHRDLVALEGGHRRAERGFQMETGQQPADDPTHVVVARAIASCGVAGGTTLEVMEQLGWRQGPASVALSRAARKGLVAATGERRHATGASPGFAVYVAI